MKKRPPVLETVLYNKDDWEAKKFIESGKYLVVRKDGKTHLETFNGSGWAYNENSIEYYYTPKIN